MAVHKVPLDVEADDKFLGPLSFKQFLFGGSALVFGYITFLTLSKGIWPLSVIFLLPTLLAIIFTIPWSKEQPSELFLASRIRFYIKPRKRIWDQSGMKHLVQITAPKQLVHELTDGLDQTQVRSRFNALATMVDSRGWAVKGATVGAGTATVPVSDRLIAPEIPMPTENQIVLQSTPDTMDENDSTIARQFDNMIQQSTVQQKSAARDIVAKARQANATPPADPVATSSSDSQQDFWFKGQNATTVQPTLGVNLPTTPQAEAQPTASEPLLSEDELLERAHEQQRRAALQSGTKHGTTINPGSTILQPDVKLPAVNNAEPATVGDSSADASSSIQASAPDNSQHGQYQVPEESVTIKRNPDILELAQSNDLNIETLARQAHKNDDGEVVISLR